MKHNADTSNAVDCKDKFWTSKLREAECFASVK